MLQAQTSKIDLESIRLLIRRKEHTAPFVGNIGELIPLIIRFPTVKELAAGIEKSPEIAMKVVKMASSAYYGGRHIRSLQHAIELLGVPVVCSMAASACMLSQNRLALKVNCLKADQYRKRALALGMFSRMLAKKFQLGTEDLQFLSGLFQESGYLLMAHYIPNGLETLAKVVPYADSSCIINAEHGLFGFTHADISGIIAQEYNLPPEIVSSLTYHHTPDEADPRYQKEADIAHLASWMANELGFSAFSHSQIQPLNEVSCLRLGIDTEEILQFAEQIKQAAEEQACILAA